MTEWIWLNGETMPLAEARIGVEDRGFQFADGVYEVIRIYDSRPFALREHLERLERSAKGIDLDIPLARESLTEEIERLIARSSLRDGMVYLQLTRGTSVRNHAFPATKPTLLFYVRQVDPLPDVGAAVGMKLISVPDERWKRCWIKSIALLPNVLAKNQALSVGADEAVFIDDGIVTECSASNLFMVINGVLVTHPVGAKVLPGITRATLISLAPKVGIKVIERSVTQEEARRAEEIFITSTTREISWVRERDAQSIRRECGPLTTRLHHALRESISSSLAP
jgi:D-alanine transaminase